MSFTCSEINKAHKKLHNLVKARVAAASVLLQLSVLFKYSSFWSEIAALQQQRAIVSNFTTVQSAECLV